MVDNNKKKGWKDENIMPKVVCRLSTDCHSHHIINYKFKFLKVKISYWSHRPKWFDKTWKWTAMSTHLIWGHYCQHRAVSLHRLRLAVSNNNWKVFFTSLCPVVNRLRWNLRRRGVRGGAVINNKMTSDPGTEERRTVNREGHLQGSPSVLANCVTFGI